MPPKGATVQELELELKNIRDAFEDYIASSKQLEQGLDNELSDMHAKLVKSKKANESLSAQLECMDPLLQNLENALETTKAKLHEEQKFRRQAEQSKVEMEGKVSELESKLTSCEEEKKSIQVECDAAHEELAFKTDEIQTLRADCDAANEALEYKSVELNDAKKEQKEYRQRLLNEMRSPRGFLKGQSETLDSQSVDSAAKWKKTPGRSSVDDLDSELLDELETVTEQLLAAQKKVWDTEDKLAQEVAKARVVEQRFEESDIGILDREKGELEVEKQRLEDELETVTQELETVNEELELTRDELRLSLDEANTKHSDEKKALEDQLATVQEELEQTREELKTSEEDADDFQAQLDYIETANMQLHTELERERESRILPEDLEEQRQHVKLLEATVTEMETLSKEAKEKFAEYDEKLERSKEENTMLEEEIICLRTTLHHQTSENDMLAEAIDAETAPGTAAKIRNEVDKQVEERMEEVREAVSKEVEARVVRDMKETVTKEAEVRFMKESRAERDREINLLRDQFKKLFKDNANLQEKLDETAAAVEEAGGLKDRIPKLKAEIARLNLALKAEKEQSKYTMSHRDIIWHKKLHEAQSETKKEMNAATEQYRDELLHRSERSAQMLRDELLVMTDEKELLQLKFDEVEGTLLKATTEYAEKSEQLQESEASLEAARIEIHSLNRELISLKASLEDSQSALESFKQDYEAVAMELELAEQLVQKARSDGEKSSSEELKDLKRKMFSLTISLEESRQETSVVAKELANAKKSLSGEHEKVEINSDAASQIEELNREIEDLQALLKTRQQIDMPIQPFEVNDGIEITSADMIEKIEELTTELDGLREHHVDVCEELDRAKQALAMAAAAPEGVISEIPGESNSVAVNSKVQELTMELEKAQALHAEVCEELVRKKQELIKTRKEAAEASKDLLVGMAKKIDQLTANKKRLEGIIDSSDIPRDQLGDDYKEEELNTVMCLVEKVEELTKDLDEARERQTETVEALKMTRQEADAAKKEAANNSKDLIFAMAKKIDELRQMKNSNLLESGSLSENNDELDNSTQQDREAFAGGNVYATFGLVEKVEELTVELAQAKERYAKVCKELDITKEQLVKAREEAAEASNDLVFEMAKKIDDLSRTPNPNEENGHETSRGDEILDLIEKVEELSADLDEARRNHSIVSEELNRTRQQLTKERNDSTKGVKEAPKIEPFSDIEESDFDRNKVLISRKAYGEHNAVAEAELQIQLNVLGTELDSAKKENVVLRRNLEEARKELESNARGIEVLNSFIGERHQVDHKEENGDSRGPSTSRTINELEGLHAHFTELTNDNEMLKRALVSNDEAAAKELEQLKEMLNLSSEETVRLKKKVVSLNTILKQAIADHAIELKDLKETLDSTCDDAASNVRECAAVEARADIEEAREQERKAMSEKLKILIEENSALQTKLEATERSLELAHYDQKTRQTLLNMFEDRLTAYDAKLKAANDETDELKEEISRLRAIDKADGAFEHIDHQELNVSPSGEHQLLALRLEVATLNETVADAKQSYADLVEELRTAKFENEELQKTIAHEPTDYASPINISGQEDESKIIREQLNKLKDEKAALQHLVDDSKIALSVSQYAQERHKEELRACESKFEAASEEVQMLRNELSALNTTLVNVKQEHASVVEEMSVLNSRIGEADNSLGKEHKAKESTIIASENAELEQKTEDVEQALEESRQELEIKCDELEAMEARLMSSQEETRMLTEEISRLSAAFETAKTEYDSVVDELEAVNELFDEARQEAERNGREAAAKEMQEELRSTRVMKEQLSKVLEENVILQRKVDDSGVDGDRATDTLSLKEANDDRETDDIQNKDDTVDGKFNHTDKGLKLEDDLLDMKISLESVVKDKSVIKDFLERVRKGTSEACVEAERRGRMSVTKEIRAEMVAERDREIQTFKDKFDMLIQANETLQQKLKDAEIGIALAKESQERTKGELKRLENACRASRTDSQKFQQEISDLTLELKSTNENHERIVREIRSQMEVERDEMVNTLKQQLHVLTTENSALQEELRKAETELALFEKSRGQGTGNSSVEQSVQKEENEETPSENSMSDVHAQQLSKTPVQLSSSQAETKKVEAQVSHLKESLSQTSEDLHIMTQRFLDTCEEAEKTGGNEADRALGEEVEATEKHGLFTLRSANKDGPNENDELRAVNLGASELGKAGKDTGRLEAKTDLYILTKQINVIDAETSLSLKPKNTDAKVSPPQEKQQIQKMEVGHRETELEGRMSAARLLNVGASQENDVAKGTAAKASVEKPQQLDDAEVTDRLQAQLERVNEERTKRLQEMDDYFAVIMESRLSMAEEHVSKLEKDMSVSKGSLQAAEAGLLALEKPEKAKATLRDEHARSDAEAALQEEQLSDLYQSESRDDDASLPKIRSMEQKQSRPSTPSRESDKFGHALESSVAVRKKNLKETSTRTDLQRLEQMQTD